LFSKRGKMSTVVNVTVFQDNEETTDGDYNCSPNF
jgi:hypothetical protein